MNDFITFCGKIHFAALLYIFPPSHTEENRRPPTISTTTTATITTTAPPKTKKTDEGESKMKTDLNVKLN